MHIQRAHNHRLLYLHTPQSVRDRSQINTGRHVRDCSQTPPGASATYRCACNGQSSLSLSHAPLLTINQRQVLQLRTNSLLADTITLQHVKLSPCLTKHHALNPYPVLNEASRHEDVLRE